jgi:D-aminopeptidase
LGVLVLLATGDDAVSGQVSELSDSAVTVIVKAAGGRFVAGIQPPTVTQPLTEKAAKHAARRLAAKTALSPCRPDTPIGLAVEFQSSDMADRAAVMPGVIRDGCRILVRLQNMPDAYRTFREIARLGQHT